MFSLTGGGRYSIDDRKFFMNFAPLGIVNESRQRRDKLAAWRVILDQKLSDNALLYYSVSHGFQGGG
jgi:outer membrane receptor protein involved in Fe transport